MCATEHDHWLLQAMASPISASLSIFHEHGPRAEKIISSLISLTWLIGRLAIYMLFNPRSNIFHRLCGRFTSSVAKDHLDPRAPPSLGLRPRP